MTDGELIAIWCEPKRTRSSHLDGWLDYPKTTRSEQKVRKFENTVNAQGNGENPCSIQNPNLDQWSLQKAKGKPLEYYPQEAHISLRYMSQLRSKSSMLHKKK